MSKDVQNLSIAEVGTLLRNREISAPEITEHYLERIDKHDHGIGAYSLVTDDVALRQAEIAQSEIDRGIDRGPLHGIPIAIKDNVDTAGVPTICNSHVLAGRVPTKDAAVVDILQRAGAVQLGKTTLHEFAFGGPAWDTPDAPARNPWDTARFTGGSSSGSAAAIAAGLAMAALGTDTVGSIRLPAALSGIVGFKPTVGRVPMTGIVPLSYSLDHCGPMAGSVDDCAQIQRVLTGDSPSRRQDSRRWEASSRGLSGLRVGYIRHFYTEDSDVSAGVLETMERSVEVWKKLGATVSEVRLSSLEVYSACCMTIMLSEALAIHETKLRTRWEDFGAIVRDRLALASLFTAADYVQAKRLKAQLFQEMTAALVDVDILVTSAFPSEAPLLSEVDKFYILQEPFVTTPFNVTGMPTVCLPAGLSASGLPIGIQIAGNIGSDEELLRIAAIFESATGFPEERYTRTSLSLTNERSQTNEAVLSRRQ